MSARRIRDALKRMERLERVLSYLPEAPDQAAALVGELGGAERIAGDARCFGLTSLLAYYLPHRFRVSTREELIARFRAACLMEVSFDALKALQSAQVQGVLLKGIAIACRRYPEPWLRPACDVDVLVSPRCLQEAISALSQAGWRQVSAAPRSRFEFAKDIGFYAPTGGLLELHFGYSADFQARIDVDQLLARSRSIALGGREIPVLSEADDMLVQCVHVAHHAFGGVKWLFDLKLLAIDQPMCWAALAELAHEYRVTSAVGMALREAARRLRAPVPASIIRQLSPGPTRAALVRWASAAANGDVACLLDSILLADGFSVGLMEEAAVRPVGRFLTRFGMGVQAKRLAVRMADRFSILRRR